jgi:hypothetical protein
MAIISKGILGGFSGTVGTVIGGNWKGIDYMRSLPKPSGKEATDAQIAQRTKFALVVRFMQALSGLVASTFMDSVEQMTGFNKALAHAIKNAITGAYPAFEINYSAVLVSKGTLPNVQAPAAVAGAAGIVTWHWTDNSGLSKATANDRAILVAYSPDLAMCVYTTVGALRSTGTDSLNIPGFSGKTVQTWIGFLSANGKSVANSIFTGQVAVV